MEATEMRAAVAELPLDYLKNYTESFEAGIVGGFVEGDFCVVGCMGNQAHRRDDRAFGYLLAMRRQPTEPRPAWPLSDDFPRDPAVDAIHDRYCSASIHGTESAFRTALYDTCVQEVASRANRVEIPETVEAAA